MIKKTTKQKLKEIATFAVRVGFLSCRPPCPCSDSKQDKIKRAMAIAKHDLSFMLCSVEFGMKVFTDFLKTDKERINYVWRYINRIQKEWNEREGKNKKITVSKKKGKKKTTEIKNPTQKKPIQHLFVYVSTWKELQKTLNRHVKKILKLGFAISEIVVPNYNITINHDVNVRLLGQMVDTSGIISYSTRRLGRKTPWFGWCSPGEIYIKVMTGVQPIVVRFIKEGGLYDWKIGWTAIQDTEHGTFTVFDVPATKYNAQNIHDISRHSIVRGVIHGDVIARATDRGYAVAFNADLPDKDGN